MTPLRHLWLPFFASKSIFYLRLAEAPDLFAMVASVPGIEAVWHVLEYRGPGKDVRHSGRAIGLAGAHRDAEKFIWTRLTGRQKLAVRYRVNRLRRAKRGK